MPKLPSEEKLLEVIREWFREQDSAYSYVLIDEGSNATLDGDFNLSDLAVTLRNWLIDHAQASTRD